MTSRKLCACTILVSASLFFVWYLYRIYLEIPIVFHIVGLLALMCFLTVVILTAIGWAVKVVIKE